MPLNSFNPAEIIRTINALESALNSMKFTAGAGIFINRTATGYTISAAGIHSGKPSNYTGIFKVTLESGKLCIRDGSNPAAENAGFLYFNQKYFDAPAGSVTASQGFLCISCNSAGTIGYSVEPKIPDMPILESATDDDTTKFPLAEIKSVSGSFTVRQILQYTPPYMTAWGPCDEE